MTFYKSFTNTVAVLMFSIFSFANQAKNKMEVEFKTGEDDLAVRVASIQGNLKITINYKDGTTPTILTNSNKNQNWPKNSIRRVSIPLTANAGINNFSSNEISRSTTNTNLEDAAADNWDLISFRATVTMKKSTATSKYQLHTKTGTNHFNINKSKNLS